MDPATLDASIPLGDYQPIPFPAPLWLMKALLILGFYLHAIPMNVALMGGLLAAIALLYAMANKEHPFAQRLGTNLATALPFFTTAAITNGIVPLLFLQVIYGPIVYSSTIAMAAPWFSILFLLALGYYGFYVFSYRRQVLGKVAPWVLIGSSLLFLVVAFFFTNNMTLMLTPEKILPMVQASPNGMNLNLTEPSLVPRYLHFVMAAVAVTALVIGCFGLYQKGRDEAYSQWLIKKGSSIFLMITVLQIGIGSWFFLSLPTEHQAMFLGGHAGATGTFGLALFLDLIAMVSAALAYQKSSAGAFKTTLISALLLIACMVMMRHFLRVFSLQGILDPSAHPVEPQWGMLAAFVALLLGLIGLTVWLAKVTWGAYHGEKHDWSKA